MSFTYNFELMNHDETYFAYSFPYTFTRLARFLKTLKEDAPDIKDCTPLCKSLSGIDVPYLIVTSRANEDNFHLIDAKEHLPDSMPV
jgi:hypothetical protein